jgi:DNA-binding CsgD family transcriptional regulator
MPVLVLACREERRMPESKNHHFKHHASEDRGYHETHAAGGEEGEEQAASCGGPRFPQESLTEGEIRVLRYLPTHLTAPEIARQLYLSVHTVTTHMRHIYAKLGVHRRHEAVDQARARGLLAPASRGRA